MSFEQIWNGTFYLIKGLFEQAAVPAILVARQLGFELNAAQVWMLLFTLLFAGYLAYFLYIDWVLSQRGRRALGTVIGLDPGDGGPDRPIVRFKDTSGKEFVVTSHLGVNRQTGSVGAQIEMVYDPNDPRRAREAGRLGAKQFYLAFLVFFVAALAAAAWGAQYAIY